MKKWCTEIKALEGRTGVMKTWGGENVEAPTWELAQQWCDENKGYLKVVDEDYKFDNWEFKDGEIINVARNEGIIELEVVKGNFFIKFATERIFNINFRTPNVTICAVFDTAKNIDNQSINVIKIGEIEDEIR